MAKASPRLVLVVEDDVSVRRPLVKFLEIHGFSVVAADTAENALEALQREQVAAAVVDLLRKGSTRRLPTKWATTSRAQANITDRQLRRTHTQKVDWAALEPDERRIFLQSLNEPPKLQLRIPSKKKSPARKRSAVRLRRR